MQTKLVNKTLAVIFLPLLFMVSLFYNSITNAAATPHLNLSQRNSISNGQTIQLEGKNYKPNYDLYIAQTIAKPASGIPEVYANELKLKTDQSGSFHTKIKVTKLIKNTNCLHTTCYIATFAAWPKLFTDRTQDVWIPITLSNSNAVNLTKTAVANNGLISTKLVQNGNTTPQVSVSKTNNLNPQGETIQVSGTGFSGKEPGIYVGVAAIKDFNATDASKFSPTTKWIRANQIKNGNWSTNLPVSAKFSNTDCTKTQCAIFTLAAHGSKDRSQDTKTLINFRSATKVSLNHKTVLLTASKPLGPQVTLSKQTGLNPKGEEITVKGTGFSGNGAGIYVTSGITNLFSPTEATAYEPSQQWIRPNQIHNGQWETKISVTAQYGDGNKYNCLSDPCSIFTLAAHGSKDRSQDTKTPISFNLSNSATDSKSGNSAQIILSILATVAVIAIAGIVISRRDRSK